MKLVGKMLLSLINRMVFAMPSMDFLMVRQELFWLAVNLLESFLNMLFRLGLRELGLIVENWLDDCAYPASSKLELSFWTANHGLDSLPFAQGFDAETEFSTSWRATNSSPIIILGHMNLLDHLIWPSNKKGLMRYLWLGSVTSVGKRLYRHVSSVLQCSFVRPFVRVLHVYGQLFCLFSYICVCIWLWLLLLSRIS